MQTENKLFKQSFFACFKETYRANQQFSLHDQERLVNCYTRYMLAFDIVGSEVKMSHARAGEPELLKRS